MNPDPNQYGPLAGLVGNAGALMAAVGALLLTWRGRAKWEPSEQDVPQGAQRVAGLATAIAIAVVWLWMRDPNDLPMITTLAIALGVACLVAFLVYSLLISALTYDKIVATGARTTKITRVIGGFWLTRAAREARREHGRTIKDLFFGAKFEEDQIWPRLSRSLAKMAFSLCYILLVSTGTIALTCAAILLDKKLGGT